MCGITGFVGKGTKSDLQRMSDSINHRGPDDQGLEVVNNKVLGSIGLGHNRLSIIDLSSAGHQPMWNEDKTVCIIFNGEIYNYKDLKSELTGHHSFTSETDTEVILHLYEEIGDKIFEKMSGMFAIAMVDLKRNIFFLARDRMGKKPLYWSLVDQNTTKSLIFGSELKALTRYPGFDKKISPSSVAEYFIDEHIVGPNTIYENASKLPPASYLTWDGNTAKIEQYWVPRYSEFDGNYEDAQAQLDKILNKSVKDRMIADVPIGIFLSGGIDSSIITWYANRQSSSKIKTFSIGFIEKTFDESSYAKKVANHIGTDHCELTVTEPDMLKVIPNLGNVLDEPMADASIVPTLLLAKLTREHVTVALGGDGGDELFFGYDTFLAYKYAKLSENLPGWLIKSISDIVNHLPSSFNNMSLDFKLKRFFDGMQIHDPFLRDSKWLASFGVGETKDLFREDFYNKAKTRTKSTIDHALNNISAREEIDKLGRIYESTYMLEHILVKVDRATMRYALEARAPFLSNDMVDFAHSLPSEYKISYFKTKKILKDLMRNRLPEDIINRPKKGFGMPVAFWLKNQLLPLLYEVSSEEFIEKQNIFNRQYVIQMIDEHISKRRDHRKKLWTFLVFQLWWRQWIK